MCVVFGDQSSSSSSSVGELKKKKKVLWVKGAAELLRVVLSALWSFNWLNEATAAGEGKGGSIEVKEGGKKEEG